MLESSECGKIFFMEMMETTSHATTPETVFTGHGRGAVNAYKRKFEKKWKKNPPTNPERFKPNLET